MGNPNICIIDKSRIYRKIVCECLVGLGYSGIETYDNPKDLLDYQTSPDIIILEHESYQSEMTGLEFFRQYGHTRFRKAKFIFLSSNTNLQVAVSAVRMGAFDYIVKSRAGLERLIRKLARLLQTKEENDRKARLLNYALATLSLVTFLFFLAIWLYVK